MSIIQPSLERLRADRRYLHQIPELDRDLGQTLSALRERLAPLPCELSTPTPGSLCVFFNFGRDDALAFRSDMDALPVQEENDVSFRSRNDGCMHACGHDGHMAVLLEFARVVSEMEQPRHNVMLIFQPAEETTGGAKDIVQSGIIARHGVKAVFGLHLWPELEAGVVATRPGDLLARSSEVTAEVFGRSAHIARSEEGRDALLAGMLFLGRSLAMERGELRPWQRRLLKFGRFESGTARNVISGHSLILGSLRSFDDDVFSFMARRLFEIARQVSDETGCSIDLTVNEGYPAVINHRVLYDCVKAVLGKSIALLPEPFLIAEDFSYYAQAAPSLFFLLGTGGREPLHSGRFNFDETILLKGVELFERLLEM